MMTLDFYFDYLSPYSYLAWKRLPELLDGRDVDLQPRPVLLAGLLDHWGQRGPAEIPAKRDWLIRDVLRFAARDGIPVTFPDPHPFNPLHALRVSQPSVCGDDQQRTIIDAVFTAVWGNGRNV
ncbi:MAG: DsbA family protein, partial [Bradymonadaceae bacterium]